MFVPHLLLCQMMNQPIKPHASSLPLSTSISSLLTPHTLHPHNTYSQVMDKVLKKVETWWASESSKEAKRAEQAEARAAAKAARAAAKAAAKAEVS